MSQTLLGVSQDVNEIFVRQVVSGIQQIKDPVAKVRLHRNILMVMHKKLSREPHHIQSPEVQHSQCTSPKYLGRGTQVTI